MALAVAVVAVLAVGGAWFVLWGHGDDDSDTAAVFTTAAPAAQATVPQDDPESSEVASPSASDNPFDGLFDDQLDDDFPDDDSGDTFGSVRVGGATAVSMTCDGSPRDRIEIRLTGNGEPRVMDRYRDGELQIDIYGVPVAYQDSFPVDDLTDRSHGRITSGVDEYGWPRLRIGADEDTEYALIDDSLHLHIIVEVYR